MNEYHSYKSAQGRAKWVQGLFVVFIVLSLFSSLSMLMDNVYLSNVISEEELMNDMGYMGVVVVSLLIGLFLMIVEIAIVVLFCMWVHRIHRNLPSLGAQNLEFTPGWAVGWYFIPFANLVQPFRAAKEAWKASDPEVEKEPNTTWKSRSVPGLITAWWVFYIIRNVLAGSAGSSSFQAETIDSIITSNYLYIVSDLANIVAAIIAIFFVRKLTQRQEERNRQMPQASPESKVWV
ncbi:DUF4328 domain-containing protein [Desmospora activa]|uniref:Uncharacterized protein DUF4328 n=1 Tax=Desmospora activa DSM 45169 TaxID=1121389 RepID=A0A2T4Z9B2_9BACL|nr:DUF4328 domain-containing protein [Desmospora activa]PTM58473.1 uncharacterized protein DUF4328 [Desmospora activa DSM 45169]